MSVMFDSSGRLSPGPLAAMSTSSPLRRCRLCALHVNAWVAPNHLALMTVTWIANLHGPPNALYNHEWTSALKRE